MAVSFFTLIFSSLLWLIYSLRFIFDNLKGISFFDAGIANIMLYTLLVCLPIFLMWAVFGFVSQYLSNRSFSLQLQKLFVQMKKNQDYSDLLARVLIETEQQVKDGFVLNRFDLLIADMNELLSEIIRGCKLASGEQIENLWNKVQNGGKWSFGKVIIEVNNSQPNFQMRIYERSVRDNVIGGTVMEFCARYLAVVKMLEAHDRDKIFLNMIETGVMGKVFSILSPVAEEIRRSREGKAAFARPEPQPASRPAPRPTPQTETQLERASVTVSRAPKKGILERLKDLHHKKDNEIPSPMERDPFSIALEKSFGEEISSSQEPPAPRFEPEGETLETEPRFEIAPPAEFAEETPEAEPSVTSAAEESPEPEELTDTQRTLNSLKQEWAGFSQEVSEKKENDEPTEDLDGQNLAYPFGSWVDEQNYRK